MSKNKMKNLLNEGTIRRFMKLAEIDTLSDDFVNTLATEEETIEEMYHAKHDDKKETRPCALVTDVHLTHIMIQNLSN